MYSKNNKNIVLFDIELITGRKHQIRAQLANQGLFIVGDKKYGYYIQEATISTYTILGRQ